MRKRYTACPQGAKPVVAIPNGAPPATLVTRDVIVGTGAVADAGTLPRVHYFLKTWSNGKEVDASYADPFRFELGSGSVIAGFDQGVTGMRVGGRREIVIPPELGYGEQGAGASIQPNETLVFVVDLIEVGS
ncbi:FKBP-type peptidyl-prolyl cis-trans isomerase [Solirubrobacter phytolaccae]|uniref:FKBP-type peptidyl-prolyl cis-trans isomerase n=1 Tax=Solirubrobacter phytolaccae TaxID=1404360 RepID=UPI003555E2BE